MTRLTRRQALRMAALSASAMALSACSLRSTAPSAPPQVDGRATATEPPSAAATPAPVIQHVWGSGPSVSITPIADFFDLAITQRRDWFAGVPYELRVAGAVSRPLVLSLDDIRALPAVEQMRAIACIGNSPGGPLIGNAVWKGARLTDVLQRASPHSSTIEVKLTGADGYTTSVPLWLAMHPDSLLVYEMNGEPLPGKHGAPLRALFPGRYGQKDPKWIVAIEAITETFLGHWERQGWSNSAVIRPTAHIRTPEDGQRVSGPTVIAGAALGNEAGIVRLEVSADGGQTWNDAHLVHGPTPLAWSEWRYEWLPPGAGDVTLMARATDADGNQQPLLPDTSVEPDAATEGAWHVHRVRVVVGR